MNKIDDFPMADEFPFIEPLAKELNEKSSFRTISYNNSNVDIVKTDKDSLFLQTAIRKHVDKATFIKVFKDSIKTIMQLSTTAQKILWYVMDNIPQNKPFVFIDYADCMDRCGFKTPKSVRDGIIELLNKELLLRSTVLKKYWVNPMVLFNGNRIVFINEYIVGKD